MSRGLVGSGWFDQIAGEEPRRLHRLLLERAARRRGDQPLHLPPGGARAFATCALCLALHDPAGAEPDAEADAEAEAEREAGPRPTPPGEAPLRSP
jgi:hypothetical protein